MALSPDRTHDSKVRCDLLRKLRQRLELAHELSAEVRAALTGGESDRIDNAAAQMETIAQEFKLLAQEYGRLPQPEAGYGPDRALERERHELESAAERIARSSAVTGGLLERLLTVSRGLLGLIGGAKDGTYQPTGRSSEYVTSGMRLKEQV